MKVPEEFAGTTGLIPGPDVGLRSDTSLNIYYVLWGIYYAIYYGGGHAMGSIQRTI